MATAPSWVNETICVVTLPPTPNAGSSASCAEVVSGRKSKIVTASQNVPPDVDAADRNGFLMCITFGLKKSGISPYSLDA